MIRKAFLAALVASSIYVPRAGAESALTLGNKPETFDLRAYLQPRYDLAYSGGENTVSTFSVRRGRLILTGNVLPDVKGRIQLNAVPQRIELLDAYLAWTIPIHEKRVFTLTAGQFKRPLSYQEFVMSSSDLNLIDRSRLNRFLEGPLKVSAEDLGGMITADLWEADLPIQAYLGLWNGTGKGLAADTDRNKQLVARVEAVPVTGFTVGADLSANWLHGDSDTLGTEATESYVLWGLEAIWGAGPAQVLGEVFSGDNHASFYTDGLLPLDPAGFLGWYAEGIYRFPSGWEPAARFDFLDTDRDAEDDAERIVTGQVAYSFSPNFRWQLNVVYHDFEDPDADSLTEFVNQFTVRI